MTYIITCESITKEKRLKLEDDLKKLDDQGFEYIDSVMATRELDHICILMHKKD